MLFPKKQRIRDTDHLVWLRELPCAKCKIMFSDGSQAAHIRKHTDGGIGIKPSDCYTVPLCAECHQLQHSIGEARFYHNRVDIAIELAKKLYEHTGDRKTALSLIKEAGL